MLYFNELATKISNKFKRIWNKKKLCSTRSSFQSFIPIFLLKDSNSYPNPSNEGEHPPVFSISFLSPHLTDVTGPICHCCANKRVAASPPHRVDECMGQARHRRASLASVWTAGLPPHWSSFNWGAALPRQASSRQCFAATGEWARGLVALLPCQWASVRAAMLSRLCTERERREGGRGKEEASCNM